MVTIVVERSTNSVHVEANDTFSNGQVNPVPDAIGLGATLVVQDSGVHAVGAAQPVQTGRPGPYELRGLRWHDACL